MRFVKLTQEQVDQLAQLYRESGNHRERQRAQALLLSNRGYTMEQLAELFVVDRDTWSENAPIVIGSIIGKSSRSRKKSICRMPKGAVVLQD